MTRPKNDLTNKKFNRLTVMYQAEDYVYPNTNKHLTMWHCKCECGNEIDVLQSSLITGNTKSCGCLVVDKGKENGRKNIKYVNKNAYADNIYDLSGEFGIGYSFDKQYYFYFDLEDYNKIRKHRWFRKEDGDYSYWFTRIDGHMVRMHRYIMDCYDTDKDVDHIYHNTYDNRKSKLRICQHFQNIISSKMYSNNTSGRKGVYWDKSREKWMACITYNKKTINLGRFENFEDAVKAREEAEKKYHCEFSYEKGKIKNG